LYTRTADDKREQHSGFISCHIAKACLDLPQFADLISDVLEVHNKMFEFVDFRDDVVIIGTPNGIIQGYQVKERKQLFDEKIQALLLIWYQLDFEDSLQQLFQ